MIEETPEVMKAIGEDIVAIGKSLKPLTDRDTTPHGAPNMLVLTEPREDGRRSILCSDYLAEGKEGESFREYMNRVGKEFIVIQGYWACGSTKSIEDVTERWNAKDVVDISENVKKTVWKQMKKDANDCSFMEILLEAELKNKEEDE